MQSLMGFSLQKLDLCVIKVLQKEYVIMCYLCPSACRENTSQKIQDHQKEVYH